MILNADARSIPLTDQSVQTVVTSPPYWGLRDYGNSKWVGGDPECDHLRPAGGLGKSTLGAASYGNAMTPEAEIRSQLRQWAPYIGECGKCGAASQPSGIGLEDSPQAWVDAMVAVFREVWRVLRNEGTVWLNVGDAYNNRRVSRPSSHQGGLGFTAEATKLGLTRLSITTDGLKEKDLIGLPWRLAFALQADGWYLRSDIIWAKPNPMPESVRDRPTKAHEYVFLLTKSPRYYFDANAVRRPVAESSLSRLAQNVDAQLGSDRANGGAKTNGPMRAVGDVEAGANVRTVWSIPSMPFSEAHFATFPPKLVEPCIKAGSAEGDVVLDPFAGSGTTGIVARKLVRRFVGLELNPDYCQMANRRIARECPANLFDEVPA